MVFAFEPCFEETGLWDVGACRSRVFGGRRRLYGCGDAEDGHYRPGSDAVEMVNCVVVAAVAVLRVDTVLH